MSEFRDERCANKSPAMRPGIYRAGFQEKIFEGNSSILLEYGHSEIQMHDGEATDTGAEYGFC